MKAKPIFWILLLLICALIPFQSGVSTSFKSVEINILPPGKPCVRWGPWTIGQRASGGNILNTTFITNSETTCCVKASVQYCKNQSTNTYPITDFDFVITMNNGFKVVKITGQSRKAGGEHRRSGPKVIKTEDIVFCGSEVGRTT